MRGAAGFLAAALVTVTGVNAAVPAGAVPTAGGFFPIAPLRLLDTRGPGGAPLGAEERLLAVAGVGSLPPAGDIAAVALSVTATEPTAASFVSVYPGGTTRPNLSNLNVVPGQTVANAVVSGLDANGQVTLFNAAGTTHLVVDVVGWYSAGPTPGGARFTPVPPMRLADTRPDRPVFGNEALVFELSSTPPYDQVRAAVVNVTATEPQGYGFFTVTPWDVPLPGASMLNFVPGQTVASSAVTSLGPHRRAAVYNGSPLPVHQVVDLNGVFVDEDATTGGAFTPVPPTRVLDTRLAPQGPFGPNDERPLDVTGSVPPAAGAVVANVTVVAPDAHTFVSLWPTGGARPGVSNVNAAPGQTVPNLVTVELGDEGKVQLFNAVGNTDVVVDVLGWYEPATSL